VKKYVKNFQAYLPLKIDSVKRQLMAELADNSRLYNYLLQRMEDLAASPLPPDQLESKLVSDTPSYSTQVKYLDPTKVPVTEQYQVSVKSGKDTATVAKGAVNIAKTHFFQLGAGLVFSVNKPDLVTVTGNGSTLNISRDANFAQFVAGIHLYIPGFGLYNLDNRFIIHAGRGKTYRKQIGISDLNRLSLFLGVGIPQPLKNYYTGISADLWPGIRLHTGLHWLWFTKYQVVNNQVTEQRSALDKGSWYIGLNIDPTSLVNLLNIFKKQ
jgi:hypothetical protein